MTIADAVFFSHFSVAYFLPGLALYSCSFSKTIYITLTGIEAAHSWIIDRTLLFTITKTRVPTRSSVMFKW